MNMKYEELLLKMRPQATIALFHMVLDLGWHIILDEQVWYELAIVRFGIS